MIKTTHIRAELHQVLAVVDATLGEEGFRRSSTRLAPRVVPCGGDTLTLPAEVPPNMRRLVVGEKDGWIAIADEPFSRTDWGKALSEALARSPVFTLEGECDYAFYSSVVVHERGTVVHRSDVPGDAAHEADGRHRVRPMFLADTSRTRRRSSKRASS